MKELESKLRPFLARRVPACDVDDVMQDVFLRMHRSVRDLRDEDRFGPWIYRIARNAATDHLRVRARHPIEEPVDIAAEETDDPESLLAPYVASFVAGLPEPCRRALTLTELEGMTQKDAADMLGISCTGPSDCASGEVCSFNFCEAK